MDRYVEVLDLLKGQGIDPDCADEYRDGSSENYPSGEWCTWLNGHPAMDEDLPCTPEQNALLNEWKKLV